MASPVYQRKIKVITGNSTGAVKIEPTSNKRLHGVPLNIVFSALNTLSAQLAALTFRIKTGTKIRREVTGTELHDYCVLNGAGHAFSNSTTTLTAHIPFAEEWFLDNIGNGLAWNPAIVGPISIEIVASSGTITVTAWEQVSDDLDAPSFGILTWEVIRPTSATTMVFSKEIEPRGALVQATIYDDAGTNAATQAALMVGPDNAYAFEDVTVAENNDRNERFGLLTGTAATTATRSDATIYDMVFVRGDSLANAIPLTGGAKMDIRAAAASGTRSILLVRLEEK
jgi:hypothetical protein